MMRFDLSVSTLPLHLWSQYGWIIGAMVAFALGLYCLTPLLKLLFPDLWRRRSQKRRIRAARKVMSKLQTIPSDAQRFAYLRKIDPFVFEELVLEAFEQRRFKIKRNSRYTGDGGIDGQFWSPGGERYLIQAKRYQGHINAAHVRALAALVRANKCKGVFVHTGRTGALSKTLADSNPDISIISGNRLLRLLAPLEVPAQPVSRAPAMRTASR